MSKVDPKRIVEDRAINRVTSLLQDQGHIVHKIDGHNDFGEDLYTSFVEDHHTTGDTIAVQVKGGTSYRSAGGYRVRVEHHGRSWLDTNVPVACVVYDPDTDALYWANASEQLHRAQGGKKELRSISISRDDVLNADSAQSFARTMRDYIAQRGEIRHALGKLSGRVFDTTDYVAYFMNEYGEHLVYRQRRSESTATLLHSDWDWNPIELTPDTLTMGERLTKLGLTTASQLAEQVRDPAIKKIAETLGDMDLSAVMDQMPVVGGNFIVNQPELAWLRACAGASEWWRSAPA
jgi:hypothetical protein